MKFCVFGNGGGKRNGQGLPVCSFPAVLDHLRYVMTGNC